MNKIDHNLKNKNHENYFSFDSALWASVMKIEPLMRRGQGRGLHILSWEKSSKFVNLDYKFTHCVVAPPQSHMAPQNSISYPWPPGGPLGPRLGTAAGYEKKKLRII